MLRIDCDTLPEGAFQEVRAIVERPKRGRWPFDELRAARDRGGLPDLALLHIQEEGKQLAVPPPIDVWFEPTALDESREDFAVLAYAELTGSNSDPRPPKPSLRRRFFLRWVRPVLNLVFDALELLALGDMLGLIGFLIALAVAPFLLITKLVRWSESPTWIVIPGGVVLRHSAQVGDEPAFTRLTPREAILRLAPMPFGWRAELAGHRRYARALTALECNVLLAVWQSRCPPPSTELLEEVI